MKPSEMIHGFTVVSARESAENCATLWEFRHEKTGAPLYWFDNGEENKTFSVAFKTVPKDDTGVFHILEHSVLCGSQSYPVKEPFVELIKSSMKTFLNAITFQDKTMYPISSRSEQDFLNLTGVYLDAVFRPLITENPAIFMQEGTRIDFDGETPSFNGVVFNEMKGANASMTTQALKRLQRLLFPDTCYGCNSGGDQEAIPTLSYEAFLDAYRSFYHPSNSILYLDGAVPLERTLRLIDGYLSAFERDGTPHPIPEQTPVESVCETVPYQIGENDPTEKKTCIIMGKQMGTFADVTLSYALRVLRNYLFDSNFSPVKKAVMETGLVENVAFIPSGRMYQYMALLFINTEAEHRETLKRVVRDAAAAIADAPTDTEALLAQIDRLALQVKEPDEPQGIDRAIDLLASRLYGGDPLLYLEHDAVIEELRRKVHTSYFADLIRACFVNVDHLAEVILTPDKTLGEQKAAAERRQLEMMLSAMSPEERAEKEAAFRKFKSWQDTPDSEEAVAALPKLRLSDVPQEPTAYFTEEKTADGITVNYHPRRANGVTYTRFFFDCSDLEPEDLPLISFGTKLYTELPTEKHDAQTLNTLLSRCTGRFNASVYTAQKGREQARVFFSAMCSALPQRLPDALTLLPEILTQTLYDDKKRIGDLLSQQRERVYRSICSGGNRYAGRRALSFSSAEMAADDLLNGIGYYRWLKAFETDFNARFDGFCSRLREILRRVCVRERLTVSLTADDYLPMFSTLKDAFAPGAPSATDAMTFPLSDTPKKEAFIIPGSVSFAATGADLRLLGTEYDGGMKVLSHILTYDYLWNEIRVRGGAYGCGCSASDSHEIKLTTYRDPTPKRSLEMIDNTTQYLASFCGSDSEMDPFIISSVASTDGLESPCEWGLTADMDLLSGRTAADRVRERREMLGTTKESLLKYRSMLEDLSRLGSRCVIGSKKALEELDDGWTKKEL